MVALAFLVPLALVAAQIAKDRAIVDARYQASAMVAALAVTDDRNVLARALATSGAGAAGRLAVYLPGQPVIGTGRAADADVALAWTQGQSVTAPAPGGLVYLQTTALDGGRKAVVEVYVPDADLRRGVTTAWLAMAGVAIVLVAGSVLVADRLGSRVVAAARGLAGAARAFGTDDFSVRVQAEGPPEIAEAGAAFNAMADRVVAFVDAERELAADLSHRLRTPLTALRLDAETLPDGAAGDRMRAAVGVLEDEVDAIITGARRTVTERHAERVDLVDVLADRLAFWAVLAEDHGRAWSITGAEHPVYVGVPRTDLIGAIDALLGNVFEHTPQGTPFAIHVSSRSLVVEDAGPGIADPVVAVQRGVSSAGSAGLGVDSVSRVAATGGGTVRVGRGPLGGAWVEISFSGESRLP